jgi:hypothetical protein
MKYGSSFPLPSFPIILFTFRSRGAGKITLPGLRAPVPFRALNGTPGC